MSTGEQRHQDSISRAVFSKLEQPPKKTSPSKELHLDGPTPKRARLTTHASSTYPLPQRQPAFLQTGQTGNTPFRIDSAGWIQWETPCLPNKGSQQHGLCAAQDPTEAYPSSSSTAFYNGSDPAHGSSAQDAANGTGLDLYGTYLSPWTDPASLQFSTEEVKKQLGRLQSQSQSCTAAAERVPASGDNDSCRQLTWLSESSHPTEASEEDLQAYLGAAHEDRTDWKPSAAPNATQAFHGSKPLPGKPKQISDLLPKGFTAASDLKAVAKQQRAPAKLRQKLSDWGVPPKIAAVYESKGLRELYPWQAVALESGEAGENLVYCAPTSGGKTVVAEILMIRKLLATANSSARPSKRYMKALVILPFVALVQEKAEHLTKALAGMGCPVKGYAGSEDAGNSMPLSERGESVAVCTIEKANVAINRLVQQSRLHKLCCVIVDEMHMITDESRGLALELSLTKLLQSQAQPQIIGMSATIGGLEVLAKWMRARLFITNYRPVPLTEHVVFDGKVFVKGACENSCAPVKPLRDLPNSSAKDKDKLVPLVAETVAEGGSLLVFCGGRAQTQSTAALVVDSLRTFMGDGFDNSRGKEARQALVDALRESLGQASNAVLENMIMHGVGYHHAGVSQEERTVVERGFRSGAIQVLTATSTLAAGINLPAKRVILRSLKQGISNVSRSQYLQMVGRAGRAGQAQSGESFLLGSGEAFSAAGEWSAVCALLEAPLPKLTSRLLSETCIEEEGSQQLQILLLESIANGMVATGSKSLLNLIEGTLLSHQADAGSVHCAVKRALGALRSRKLLTFREQSGRGKAEWVPTVMGRAVFESAMPTDQGTALYHALARICNSELALQDMAQLIFLIIQEHPFQISNWSNWRRNFSALPLVKQRIAGLLGVKESYILKRCSGGRSDPAVAARHEKFAATCVLQELLSGRSIALLDTSWRGPDGLGQKGIDSGELQRLQTNLTKWAAMAAVLCASASWWQLEALFSMLSAQAAAGAKPELLPLMKVEAITAAKARLLYSAGLTSIEAVAAATEDRVAEALAVGVKSRKPQTAAQASINIGKTGAVGTNALLARDAKKVWEASKDYVAEQVSEFHKIWMENQDSSQ